MTMCTQTHYRYSCGCKQKGVFEQCDRLFDLGANLQCAITDNADKTVRSYCSKHLLKEGKGGNAYHGSDQQDPNRDGGGNVSA
jgi:hypothetical protein